MPIVSNPPSFVPNAKVLPPESESASVYKDFFEELKERGELDKYSKKPIEQKPPSAGKNSVIDNNLEPPRKRDEKLASK